MILQVDPVEKIIYVETPMNVGEFMDAFYSLSGPDPEADYEWVIVPKSQLLLLSQS